MPPKKFKLTRHQRALVLEMAEGGRKILIMKHPQEWMGLRYSINSFPMRRLNADMVARLARLGYLQTNRRGFYELTVTGMLEASLEKARRME